MEITYKSGAAGALWKPSLYTVYLFTGEEDRLKEEATAALIKRVVSPDFQDFDLERLDGESASASDILSAANQVPFGSERRLVLVKGMEAWRERGKQEEAEKLASGIGRLGDSVCLALVAAAQDDEAKRKTAVTVKLDNAVKKAGAIVSFRALKGDSLLDWVSDRASKEGKRIETSAAEQLVEAVGGEMLPLEQEIVKLVCYIGERETIVPRDVAAVVSSSPEDVMFTVIDAVVRKQTDRALTLLGELHRYDPKPQAVAGKLLALLARQYRMLWQAKFLAEKRIDPRTVRALPPEIAAELPSEGNIAQLAFKAGDLFAQARKLEWDELREALELLLLCDLANKGGVTDETGVFGSEPVHNLQLLTLELTGATRARAS